MKARDIRWGRALGGALAAEAALIASAFAWVAIYSYLVHPGETAAFYQRYAQRAVPWVAVGVGIPIFYAAARWIARSWPTAMGLFAIFLVVDGSLLLMADDSSSLPLWEVALSYLTKLLACHLGGRHATATLRAQAA